MQISIKTKSKTKHQKLDAQLSNSKRAVNVGGSRDEETKP